jgi:hypothetical protein
MTSVNQDYPRMMFHPTRPWVIVLNETEEAALGPEWSRRTFPDPPPPDEGPQPEPEPGNQGRKAAPPDEAQVKLLQRKLEELRRENQALRRRKHRKTIRPAHDSISTGPKAIS